MSEKVKLTAETQTIPLGVTRNGVKCQFAVRNQEIPPLILVRQKNEHQI